MLGAFSIVSVFSVGFLFGERLFEYLLSPNAAGAAHAKNPHRKCGYPRGIQSQNLISTPTAVQQEYHAKPIAGGVVKRKTLAWPQRDGEGDEKVASADLSASRWRALTSHGGALISN